MDYSIKPKNGNDGTIKILLERTKESANEIKTETHDGIIKEDNEKDIIKIVSGEKQKKDNKKEKV